MSDVSVKFAVIPCAGNPTRTASSAKTAVLFRLRPSSEEEWRFWNIRKGFSLHKRIHVYKSPGTTNPRINLVDMNVKLRVLVKPKTGEQRGEHQQQWKGPDKLLQLQATTPERKEEFRGALQFLSDDKLNHFQSNKDKQLNLHLILLLLPTPKLL